MVPLLVSAHKDMRAGCEIFERERLPWSVLSQTGVELGGAVVFKSRRQELSWKSYGFTEYHFSHCYIEVLLPGFGNASEDDG